VLAEPRRLSNEIIRLVGGWNGGAACGALSQCSFARWRFTGDPGVDRPCVIIVASSSSPLVVVFAVAIGATIYRAAERDPVMYVPLIDTLKALALVARFPSPLVCRTGRRRSG
jgi:hypothetical protein